MADFNPPESEQNGHVVTALKRPAVASEVETGLSRLPGRLCPAGSAPHALGEHPALLPLGSEGVEQASGWSLRV